jgi:hypothetical protein
MEGKFKDEFDEKVISAREDEAMVKKKMKVVAVQKVYCFA